MKRRPAAAALLVVLAVGGCADPPRGSVTYGPGSGVGSWTTTDAVADLPPALCLAADQATTDAGAARATFFDRVHEPVHELARRLETVDRASEAAVLEAKQRVEADFDRQPPTASSALAADLERLGRAVATGGDRLGIPALSCAK